MSLRQEILNEIKNMLNENFQDAKEQFFKYTRMKEQQIESSTTPEDAQRFLQSMTDAIKSEPWGDINGILQPLQMSFTRKLRILCRKGNVGNKFSKPLTPRAATENDAKNIQPITLCPPNQVSPTPAEPSAGAGKEKIEVTTTDSSLKGPGCKPGSQFIGLNGKLGPSVDVQNIQNILANLLSQLTTGGGSGARMKSTTFSFANHEDQFGKFGLATETAVKEFQRIYGQKYAEKIRSMLGAEHPLEKVDGCVGPKTACALILAEAAFPKGSRSYVEQQIAGYTMSRCKQKFGKAINKGALKESKNWLDRTREDTTSSLFERLVQDVSKKKVL